MKFRAAFWFRMIMPVVIAGWVISCQTGEEPEPEKPQPATPRLVGSIASVHENEGFVLVEGFGDVGLGDGLLLTSHGEEGRSANLFVTGEKLGRYSAADIKSGEAKVGDAVYARPSVKEGEDTDFTPDPVDQVQIPANSATQP